MRKNHISELLFLPLLVFLLTICQAENEATKESANVIESSNTGINESPVHEFDMYDDFQDGILSQSRWNLTRQNDFQQSIIDVVDVSQNDYRLRMLAATIGTADDTVKFHGIRSLRKIDFEEGKIISFDLDWNNQTNGSYLTAGIYLCTTSTDANPRDELNWLAFEYVGVPPGENARFQVTGANKGNIRFLFTEGWPDKQHTGRKIANQHIELIIDKNKLRVLENGVELFSTDDHRQNFTQTYLYFQMSSHSNYPSREIYFDNIAVRSASLATQFP